MVHGTSAAAAAKAGSVLGSTMNRVGKQMGERVQPWLQPFDTPQNGADDLHRGDRPAADHRRKFGRRQISQFGVVHRA